MIKGIHIYGNGSAGNHGCEAITRSLHKILNIIEPIIIHSPNCAEDYKYGLGGLGIFSPLKNKISQKSFSGLVYRIKQYFQYSDTRFFNSIYKDFLKNVVRNDIYISAGGDNYSYGYNTWLECLNRGINKRGGKTVLLGCSILEQIKNPSMITDLSLYHTIIARESLSYNALIQADVRSNILICPDPAFILDKTDLPLPKGFIEGQTIGINISPMVIERENKAGVLLSNYVKTIEYIIKNSDWQIALIPHVVWQHSNDLTILRELYSKFKSTGRVILINDHNSEELKGFISRCRFMIASRTHASIAAYSTGVPTLVVGYSVKAKGIATDLFGNYNDYVLPVENIDNECKLLSAFINIIDNEEAIKSRYRCFLPIYIQKLYEIPDTVKSIMA